MPKIFGAKSLSADGIAQLLGYADAAEMVAAIGGEVAPVAKTASFTVGAGENYIRCSHASTPIVATLPAASGSGRSIRVLNLGVALTSVIRAGSDLIGGAATLWLPQYASCVLVDAASAVWDIASFTVPTVPHAHFNLAADATGLAGSYADVVIPWDTQLANVGGGWTNSGGTLTCVLPGYWRVGLMAFNPSPADFIAKIKKNSTVESFVNRSGSASHISYVIGQRVNFAAGDTLAGISAASATHTISSLSWIMATWEGR